MQKQKEYFQTITYGKRVWQGKNSCLGVSGKCNQSSSPMSSGFRAEHGIGASSQQRDDQGGDFRPQGDILICG